MIDQVGSGLHAALFVKRFDDVGGHEAAKVAAGNIVAGWHLASATQRRQS